MQADKGRIGVVGASGYAGMELSRILAGHPLAELAFLTSDRWEGRCLREQTGIRGEVGALRYVGVEEAEALAGECDAVLLATPAEASLDLVPRLLETGTRVIDLSGAFRFRDPALYPDHYGFVHSAPQLLEEAVYGLCELARDRIPGARLVANPGCYPTAASLPLAPLLAAGLLEPAPILIWAASGVSGAGRKASEAFSFCEIDGDFRAYRVFSHQHTPEIGGTLSLHAGTQVGLTFTPHLLPLRRGILCTTHARLRPGVGAEEIRDTLGTAYGAEAFVSLAEGAEDVSLKQVVGTNDCRIGFAVRGEQLLLISAIDNLVKGAAGQAVQNLNLLLGWDEGLGLSPAKGHHP